MGRRWSCWPAKITAWAVHATGRPKGVYLLGVRMVIVESYERIHRSNLVGMGVLPLQYFPGETAESLGLDGTELFSTLNLADNLQPGQTVKIKAVKEDGSEIEFRTLCRIDTPVEVTYYRNGGILHTVLRDFLKSWGFLRRGKARLRLNPPDGKQLGRQGRIDSGPAFLV